MIVDLLEGLAVEPGLGDGPLLRTCELLADFEVGLLDLGQAGVDDLLVQLVLFLEAEHLGGLLGQRPHQPVEDEVVEIGVVDAN